MKQTDVVESVKHAREMKASILKPAPTSTTTDNPSTPSPEDTLITTLRAKDTSWADITTALNNRCTSRDEEPTWTEAAVYSRFILSGHSAAIPTPAREIGFQPSDYAYLRNAGIGREGTSKAGKKRVKDFQYATELSANIRKPVHIEGQQQGDEQAGTKTQGKGKGKAKEKKGTTKGKDEVRRKGEVDEVAKMDGKMVEQLMRAVAKVERNLWVYVADEMERECGKYFEPKVLEKVFHEL